MPRYDYRCGACEHRYENWSTYADRLNATCPNCGKTKSEIVFKATYTYSVAGSKPGQACSPKGGFS